MGSAFARLRRATANGLLRRPVEEEVAWCIFTRSFPAVMSLIDFQRKILRDSVRNRAFAEALRKTVRKGKTTVADIGAGTGFLSFLAAKLGAKECYLFEHSGALRIAEKLARANRIRNVHFFQEHTSQIIDPPKVDLVMSETLGNFGIDEGIVENMEDGKHMLKRGGTLIPQRLELFVAPLVREKALREINVWDSVGFSLDFSAAKEVALNNIYVEGVTPADLLQGKSAVQRWDSIDFRKRNRSVRRGDVSWILPTAETIFGFATWWEAQLLPGIVLSTSPFAPKTHWGQVLLPLLQPLEARKGDMVQLKLQADTRQSIGLRVQWEAMVQRRGKTVQKVSMDMRKGE